MDNKNNRDYKDNDDLELYGTYIKSVLLDWSKKSIIIFCAKARDSKYLEYDEFELIISDVESCKMENNIKNNDVPEIYRSAIIEIDVSQKIESSASKLYYFGIEWDDKYIEWEINANSIKKLIIRESIKTADLLWVK